MTLLVAFTASGLEIFTHLDFEGLGEHLPRSGSCDLVEIEQ